MQIEINKEIINVIINYKKIKNIYFRFDDKLNLVVSANKWVSNKEILRLIKLNENNILKMYLKTKEKTEYNQDFYYLGDKYEIIIDNNIKKVMIEDNKIYVSSLDSLNKFYLKECKRFLTVRYERCFNLFESLPKCNLKFRKMKTRWGVCNYRTFTITLNTELLKKEVSLIDYVIIHELCHLIHHDHSKNFWDEVSKFYPNYKIARKMLK